jgi:hypothetical protein
MHTGKLLFVALTRFYGIVMLFWCLFYTTYLGPYYHRLFIVYAGSAAHSGAVLAFWTEMLHVILRLVVGLILFVQAEKLMDSLRPPETEPSLRSLVVAIVKLNGLILLFYGALSLVDSISFFINYAHLGSSAFIHGAPGILRVGLDLLAGFLVVTFAEKIIRLLERPEPGSAAGIPAAAPS